MGDKAVSDLISLEDTLRHQHVCVDTLKSTAAVGVISRVAAVASNLRKLTDTLCLPLTAAVLAAADPKLLKCGSTAVADTTSDC